MFDKLEHELAAAECQYIISLIAPKLTCLYEKPKRPSEDNPTDATKSKKTKITDSPSTTNQKSQTSPINLGIENLELEKPEPIFDFILCPQTDREFKEEQVLLHPPKSPVVGKKGRYATGKYRNDVVQFQGASWHLVMTPDGHERPWRVPCKQSRFSKLYFIEVSSGTRYGEEILNSHSFENEHLVLVFKRKSELKKKGLKDAEIFMELHVEFGEAKAVITEKFILCCHMTATRNKLQRMESSPKQNIKM